MPVTVKRPRTVPEIKALIRERKRHIASLEKALAVKGLPASTRKHLQQNLRGEKNNMQSWIDYLEKRAAA